MDIYYWYPVDEAWVAANHLIIHGTPPNSQELSSPKYNMVPRLRNPALK